MKMSSGAETEAFSLSLPTTMISIQLRHRRPGLHGEEWEPTSLMFCSYQKENADMWSGTSQDSTHEEPDVDQDEP